MTSGLNIDNMINELEGGKTGVIKPKTTFIVVDPNIKETKTVVSQALETITASIEKIKKLKTYKTKEQVSLEDIDYLKQNGVIAETVKNIFFTSKPSASGIPVLRKAISLEEVNSTNVLMELFKTNSELMAKYITEYNSSLDNYKNLMMSLGAMGDMFISKVSHFGGVKYTKTRMNGSYINLLTFPLNDLILDKIDYEVEVTPTFQESIIQIKEIFSNPCFKQLIQSDEIKDICGLSEAVSLLEIMRYFTSGRANIHVSELKTRLDQIHTSFIEVSAMATGSDDITYYEITYRKMEELYSKALTYIGFIHNIITTITPITVIMSNFDILEDA